MMEPKFKNKYRISAARLSGYDYASEGLYFITICTKDRIFYFGDIVDNEMKLSEMGQLTHQFWIEIPVHFPFIILGDFVIMPNHIHGILQISRPVDTGNCPSLCNNPSINNNQIDNIVETGNNNIVETGNNNIVETGNCPSLQGMKKKWNPNQFGVQSNNLASAIRGFKSSVKRYANQNNIDFAWQARYHDHIIRNQDSLQKIQQYIQNNPAAWKDDRYCE